MSEDGSWLSAQRRARELAALGGEPVDVLVVGGGITGVGVALDAASRGLRVVLVERGDLASGTSRWSSKLAHGGLRYIAHGQLGVAYESAVERNRLVTTVAPHLIRPMTFLMPVLPHSPRVLSPGLRAMMTVANGLRAVSRSPAELPWARSVGGEGTRHLAPALAPGVRRSYTSVDGCLEDDVRLVLAVARTAASYGARILTQVEAVEVDRSGARLRDRVTGEERDCPAAAVVVAAGVWSGRLVDGVTVQPSKGAHLVVRSEALDAPRAAVNIMQPGSMSRFVMAVPRPDGTVIVGLTDDAVDAVEDVPTVTAEEETFLLETLSSGMRRPVTSADVIGRYAGLRPLLGPDVASLAAEPDRGRAPAESADVSRRHALLDRDGVLVIVGGKLTTYRRMAQDTVDRIVATLGRGGACVTARLPLVGAPGREAPDVVRLPERLPRRFGGEAARVAAAGVVSPLDALAPGVPALRAEVAWALRAEGALTVDDVLDGRLRLDLVPAWRSAARPAVEQIIDDLAGSAAASR